MENLKYLLKEINILNQRIKDREEHEDTFNLFDLMCNRYDEVNLHSRFLSVLLDPAGSHKMKDSFVRLLIDGKTGADWDSAPEQTGTLLMLQS